MEKIKIHDLKRISDYIQEDLNIAYMDVMSEGNYLRGVAVKNLETAWTEYTGAEDCCALTSGTDAIHTAAMISGVGPGDEVICCSHSYIATVEPFIHQGANIRWVDRKLSDYNLDEDKIEEQITDKTKVITWADINGQAPDLDKIVAIAKKHNLLTIQDAAPSAGSKYKNKRIGHKDHKIDMTCFSFGPVKNFGAIGGAGAITGAKEYVEQARIIKDHGRANRRRYDHNTLGWNRNIHTLQAAFLMAKLPYLDELNDRKREHAKRYNQRLHNVVNQIPIEQINNHHVYHHYGILVDRRLELTEYLKECNIEALAHWPKGLHEYDHTPNSTEELTNTKIITNQTLSLPCSPFLHKDEQDYIIEHIIKFYEET